jgi:hypothetical protein
MRLSVREPKRLSDFLPSQLRSHIGKQALRNYGTELSLYQHAALKQFKPKRRNPAGEVGLTYRKYVTELVLST